MKDKRIIIKAENLTRRFSSGTAVDGISFEVRQGEMVGFLGPNGAGKSTTLRILAGFLTATDGNVQIDGLVRTVVVTLNDGFKWADGTKTPLTFTQEFTDVSCDLPETGGKETFLAGGIGALALMAISGFLLLRTRRQGQAS